MKILRVFPYKTSMTPIDNLVRFGFQSLALPEFDEIHVSICFTWDITLGYQLKSYWRHFGKVVKIGGPAFPLASDPFSPGRYIKHGVTITSRGCDFNCPWCLVPKNEGKFRTIKINPGNIIQDNNILLAPRSHLNSIFSMLKSEKRIQFKGGLDCRLLKDWHIEELQKLRIREIWLSLDSDDRLPYFKKACEKLKKAGFPRDKLRTYVLAGYNEPIQKSEERLRLAYDCGTLPYIQVYQPFVNYKRMAGEDSRKDNLFVRLWSRPAAIKTIMKEGR